MYRHPLLQNKRKLNRSHFPHRYRHPIEMNINRS